MERNLTAYKVFQTKSQNEKYTHSENSETHTFLLVWFSVSMVDHSSHLQLHVVIAFAALKEPTTSTSPSTYFYTVCVSLSFSHYIDCVALFLPNFDVCVSFLFQWMKQTAVISTIQFQWFLLQNLYFFSVFSRSQRFLQFHSIQFKVVCSFFSLSWFWLICVLLNSQLPHWKSIPLDGKGNVLKVFEF